MVVLKNIALFFSQRQIVDNRLNPVYLAIATTGYKIQSQLLRIPDHYGFFAPAPPRLQAREGAAFAGMVMLICYMVATAWFVINLASSIPNARRFMFALFLMTVETTTCAIFWYVQCTKASRKPGYIWKDRDQQTLKRE